MTTNLLPELVSASVDMFRRAFETSCGDVFSKADMDVLVDVSRGIVRMIGRFHSAATDLLNHGAESLLVKAHCERVATALDVYLDTLPIVIRSLESRPPSVERSDWLAALGADENSARDLRRTIAEWLAALNRQPRPVDLDRVRAEAKADREAGRYVRVERFEDVFGEPE